MDKIAMLTEILSANPADSFARYGLAMAHLANGDTDAALEEFQRTTDQNPDYVPAYQMAAQTFATARTARGLPMAAATSAYVCIVPRGILCRYCQTRI